MVQFIKFYKEARSDFLAPWRILCRDPLLWHPVYYAAHMEVINFEILE